MPRRYCFRLRGLLLNLPSRQALRLAPGNPPSNGMMGFHDGCNAHAASAAAANRAAISLRAARSRSLLRKFVLGDNRFEPCDILQQALAGQDQEVIAELPILEADVQKLFIS